MPFAIAKQIKALLLSCSTFGLSAGILLSDMGIAHADLQLASALACQPAVGTDGEIAYSKAGYVYNNATSGQLWVLCPMNNEWLGGGSDTLDDESSFVYAYVPDFTFPISCWIKSSSNDDGVVWTRQASTSSPDGWQKVSFGASGDPSYSPITDDVMYMECRIPPLGGASGTERSRVYGVLYSEVD